MKTTNKKVLCSSSPPSEQSQFARNHRSRFLLEINGKRLKFASRKLDFFFQNSFEKKHWASPQSVFRLSSLLSSSAVSAIIIWKEFIAQRTEPSRVRNENCARLQEIKLKCKKRERKLQRKTFAEIHLLLLSFWLEIALHFGFAASSPWYVRYCVCVAVVRWKRSGKIRHNYWKLHTFALTSRVLLLFHLILMPKSLQENIISSSTLIRSLLSTLLQCRMQPSSLLSELCWTCAWWWFSISSRGRVMFTFIRPLHCREFESFNFVLRQTTAPFAHN